MLRLSQSTVRDILRWAEQHPEVEVCGLVWATQTFQTVHPLTNVHPEPSNYYRTAPRDVREAFTRMDDEGGEPLAWYHSHPKGKSDPSTADMEGAFNTGMYYLIAYPWDPDEARNGEGSGVAPSGPLWRLSAWECLEQGILIGVDYEVGP